MIITIKKEDGFTLVELMITLVIFVMVIIGASTIFSGLLTQFKQQSKMAETNIEGAVGLDVMRRDIEHAGMGLPWSGLTAYNEAVNNYYNLNDAPLGAPRAIFSQNNVSAGTGPAGMIAGSDYLVVRGVNVVSYSNNVSDKWTFLRAGNTKVTWDVTSENLDPVGNPSNPPDWVIVVSGSSDMALVTSAGSFATAFNSTSGFAPSDTTVQRLIYGIAPGTMPAPRMPFNRADFYVRRPPAGDPVLMPQRCAANTGVLFKAVVDQATGAQQELPLLDCVADMQVIYRWDRNRTGHIVNADTTDSPAVIGTGSALDIRNQVREVRVYVLAHEGQIDRTYAFNNFTQGYCPTCVLVGENDFSAVGRVYDLSNIPDYLNYRWKLYTLVVKTMNLR
jgi:prepilin-type N-terminal cleavage/methylation domain-containing protein